MATLARLLLAAVCLCPAGSFAQSRIPVLNWTERSDWINIKTDVIPAAVGDGIADDTAAIQAALDAEGAGNTIYFPPGTYKVTRTLTLTGGIAHYSKSLVGCGRATTLAWYGPPNTAFVIINGNPYSRYEGLTLDGRGLASIGFVHHNTRQFETYIRYRHIAFYNFTATDETYGWSGGVYAYENDSYALAEVSFENCVFNRCTYGVIANNWNDYDWTLVGCDFIQCGTGIKCSHGNFYARDCYFEGSTYADIYATPEHGCSVRRCKSVGSARFIRFANGVSPLVVQDCYVTGWTGTEGAIRHFGSPTLVLSHSRFVNPPDALAPVRSDAPVVLCDNAAPQSPVVATGTMLYAVPAGANVPRIGTVTGAGITTFVNPYATVPTNIFDAKVNFGAAGNGVADDTAAIQNTIDAAREAGGGAMAYLPNGRYRLTATLMLTGSNYVFGGNGLFTRLRWAGAAGASMVKVADANNVRLENIMVGDQDAGLTSNDADIEQTSTGVAPSTVIYDRLYTIGPARKLPDSKGLVLNGLGSNCTVVINLIMANLRFSNSANATVIGNITYEGVVAVSHTNNSPRTGFLGFQTRLSTINTYGMYIHDNVSLVASDWYTEQADNGMLISGGEGNPPGRLTIQGAKFNPGGVPDAVLMSISNYQGQIFCGSDQMYVVPPVEKIVQTGTRPLNIVLWGNCWYNTRLSNSFTTATIETLGNMGAGTGVPPPDSYTPQTLTNLSLAFDDLQRLGGLDLDLNFAHLQQSPPANTPPTAAFTAPTNGARCTLPEGFALAATAGDPDGTVIKVDFYQGGTFIGTDTTPPYGLDWNNMTSGVYSLTARAMDNLGAETTSTVVTVTVNPDPRIPPAVTLTAPLPGASFAEPATIVLNATASDSDGTVTNVTFYQGALAIGSDTNPPFSIVWSNVAKGTYSLTAKAVDNQGASAVSSAIGIGVTVSNLPAGFNVWSFTSGNSNWMNWANWVRGHVPTNGESVMIDNASVTLTNSTAILNSLVLTNRAKLYVYSPPTNGATSWGLLVNVTGRLAVVSNSWIYPYSNYTNGGSPVFRCSNLVVDATSGFDANEKGYAGGLYALAGSYSRGYGPGGSVGSTYSSGGGGYGGQGGTGFDGPAYAPGGSSYGSYTNPADPGSGSGGPQFIDGKRGGGLVRIEAADSALVDGSLLANGQDGPGYPGAGSGGGICIRCRTFQGTGLLKAVGGDDIHNTDWRNGGAGGGGRIAVVYNPAAQAGISPQPTVRFNAAGGSRRVAVSSILFARQSQGRPGSLFLSDNQFFDFTRILGGEIMVPGVMSLTTNTLALTNDLIAFPSGFTLTVSQHVSLAGAGGMDLSNSVVRIGGDLVINSDRRASAVFRGGAGQLLSMGTNLSVTKGWIDVNMQGMSNATMDLHGTLSLDEAILFLRGHLTNVSSLNMAGNMVATNQALAYLYSGTTNGQTPYALVVKVGGAMTIATNCWVYPFSHDTNGGSVRFRAAALTVMGGGGFDATGKGYRGGGGTRQVGFGAGASAGGSSGSGGAGYGGVGGWSKPYNGSFLSGGPAYGVSNAPNQPGSGGSSYVNGPVAGAGGGLIDIEAAGAVIVDGSLLANGTFTSGYGSPGSGGGIHITCKWFEGVSGGMLAANGGNGWTQIGNLRGSGGGGGGRIAVWSRNGSNGWAGLAQAGGGVLAPNNGGPVNATNGVSGTVVWIRVASPPGTLLMVR